jgi:multidrug efflux system outer membrane protein
MNLPMKPLTLSLLAVVLVLQGCATTSDAARGAAVEMPANWDNRTASGEPAPVTADWWRSFGSAPLERLIDEALAGSPDLRIALERIRRPASPCSRPASRACPR